MLTGLWHGAAWNFVLWGVYYGVLLILEKYVFAKVMQRMPSWLSHALTLLIVIIGWVFFRATTLGEAVHFVGVLFGAGGAATGEAIYFINQFYPEFILCLVGIFPIKRVLERYIEQHKQNKAVFLLGEILPKVFALIVFVLGYMKLVSGSFNPFIYFQF